MTAAEQLRALVKEATPGPWRTEQAANNLKAWRTRNADALFSESAPDGHTSLTQSRALGEGNDPASGADALFSEEDDLVVLGKCSHGVDLDREFCQFGCRV